MSAGPQLSASGSRSRPQARKKVSDDAAYFGPPAGVVVGAKRAAPDRDGEPRAKRKRVDTAATNHALSKREGAEADTRASLVEFTKLPTSTIYRYLTQFDLVPSIHPSPLTADDPPAPNSLTSLFRHPSRAPSPPLTTPANRPRRESKDQTRRRSSRLVEDDVFSRTPILADVDELHVVLAGIAEKHFREIMSISGREEVDTLASFMCAVEKAKGGRK